MNAAWSPVIAATDPGQTLEWFAHLPGVTVDHQAGIVSCGDLHIRITAPDVRPSGFRPLPFDHLALRVGDVDEALLQVQRTGTSLHTDFTPDGPREIAAFWSTGVRFVFVSGPNGLPVELCAPRGRSGLGATCTGLDHLGVRVRETGAGRAAILSRGGTEVAHYTLADSVPPVDVCFLAEGNLMWEVFDEPAPFDLADHYVGIAPAT